MMRTTLERIRGEFLEMPGLRLTVEQAQRLCGVDRVRCQKILNALVDAKFLSLKPDGKYGRASDGGILRATFGDGERIDRRPNPSHEAA